jgi:3-demethylubiquinone-9 3-methyltransferase
MTSLAPQKAGPEAATTTAPNMQKITPFLWFDDDAEEAIRFYCSLFPDSALLSESRWGPGGPVPAGTLMRALPACRPCRRARIGAPPTRA